MSRTLVLRGLPGVGKSALLDYAVKSAADVQVVRTVAVEPEQGLGFAAVHQLLLPLLPALHRLPQQQRRALGVGKAGSDSVQETPMRMAAAFEPA